MSFAKVTFDRINGFDLFMKLVIFALFAMQLDYCEIRNWTLYNWLLVVYEVYVKTASYIHTKQLFFYSFLISSKILKDITKFIPKQINCGISSTPLIRINEPQCMSALVIIANVNFMSARASRLLDRWQFNNHSLETVYETKNSKSSNPTCVHSGEIINWREKVKKKNKAREELIRTVLIQCKRTDT